MLLFSVEHTLASASQNFLAQHEKSGERAGSAMLSSSFAEQRRAKGAAAAAVAAAQVSPARIVLSSSSSEDDTGTHESYQPDLTGYAASTMEGAIVGYELAGASDSISYELPPENPSSPTPGTRPLLVRQGTGLGEPHVKDWQRRHESAQLVTCDRHRIEALSLLAQEFSFMAQMYAEVICVERDLPVAEKTIKPATQMGGVAGGEKYLAGNILFKFCEDHQFSNGSYLYGGDRPFDEAAAKGAGQERKALQAVQQHFGIRSASDVIYTPLFATVDFRGFRLSCQSLITGISGATLVVGSKDGGHHIAVPGSDDRRTHDIVSELGRALNRAPHRVLERSSGAVHEIALAADCEIHRSDGQLYLIDSARLFPPTAPDARRPREVFFKLFRSEFLSWYARNEPLSSDAFSAFAAPADQIEQNRRVMQATLSLFRDRIPEVAEMLEALPVSGRVTGADLTRLVQQYGVNVRFLGRIRKECTSQWLRDALGMEMAARAAAKHLQRLMRESRGSSAVPFLQLAVTTFNELRTGEPPWLRPDVAAKFGADTIADVDTLSCRCRRLVARVGVLVGVEILSQGLSDQVDHVTLSDLRLVSRVKELSYSQIAHAESLRLESKLRPPSSQRRVALLLQARDVLMRELCSNPRDQLLRSRYARVLLNLCKHGGGGEHCDALENNLVHMNVAQVDVFYARSKLLRLRFLRELEADNVTLAVQHYLQVSDTLKSMLSGAQNWAVIEVASYVSKLEQLKVRVLTQDPLAIVRRSRDPTVVLQISSCGAVIRQEFERLVNAAPNGPEVSRFFAACLTLGLCTAADFSASVNSRSVCLGLTDAVGGLMGPLIGHVRELTLPNACLSHEAFALLLSSAPLLESLTARALFGVTIDFPFPPQLKRAQLADALVAPEWRPPATLEELRLSACYTRHGRFDNEMPEGLKVLWLPGNVLLTAAVMRQLPRGLRVLRGSRVETGAWPALNDSCAASLVELQFGNTDPSLATVSMPLLEAFDGGPLTAEEVLLNVVKSPALRKLAICGSPMMDEAAYRVLVQCPRLEDLDCSFNAHFTSASVVAALQKNGARLRRLAAKDSWGLRDLHLIVAPEMEMLRVYLDRQPFMFGEHLRDLRLEDLEGFDETKLSGLYRLERLTVSTCPISAEVLRGLLVSSCASLQRLELCNLIGKFDFELPELAVLRTLIVKNSFREAGLRMLAKTPALERLELENAFEAELFSDASVVASLPWLRRLSVVSAGSNLQDTNGVLRRLTRLERLEIGLALTVLGTVVGHSLPPFLRRVKLIAREMTLPHTLIEAFAKCQLLAQLIFPRSVLTVR
jgi:hypothetical protein